MTNKLKYGFLILVLGSIHSGLFAQFFLRDGVTATDTFISIIKKNYAAENSMTFDLDNMHTFVKIPVRVHIIKNNNGDTGVDPADVNGSVSTANIYFQPVGIQFFIDSVDYVNDYNYSYITYNQYFKELLNQHVVPNRINLFLADSIRLGQYRSYGLTYFPNVADSNFIFLDKQFVVGKYLTTLLGHFMGLLSTHETKGGAGLASESNCATSGDFICDTYADPGLFGQVDTSCIYQGNFTDTGSGYYVPSVANIMSDSPDKCKCIFTPLQYRRIYFYFLKYRQYLKY